ncbi:CocE/NonD family hydrolase [Subtercola boreus]|uniref:Hydrolase n=1 Tax=Subtercola boreus TaxID=120213 RepID=A0A3E0W8Q3_9MICO|nr:CocE/NonD family hydrolase [Subtercola boreus]RFA18834.1 hydrolase [Subtercola boreus]RFA18948.1 hydrolase [Subtercola boreus]RFA25486.1 hydrolase [Subtercola boreus]
MTSTLHSTTLQTGVVAGPIAGLKYATPTRSGLTNERGEYCYLPHESVVFSVGGIVLGSVPGSPRVTLAQLVDRNDGKLDRLHDPMVTNLARFVQTLDDDGDYENGTRIAPAVHDLIGPAVLNFNQAATDAADLREGDNHSGGGTAAMVAFSTDQTISFATDPTVLAVLETLNAADGVFTANTPRKLRNGAAARNELRRNIRGILKLTDVRIPTRDGSYVCADVFLPDDGLQHPVIMNQGFYGKGFDHGAIGSAAEAEAKEELEDRYFTGNPDGLQYENHESVDSSIWVPKGYVCIRVDARGVGNSPGQQAPFSRQQAEDYYDAIEWAGTQPWSNGNVGLWGMSYLAITQHTVASLQPPHLKAMIALGTDSDLYNEALYGGGLYGEGFWTWWRAAMAGHNFHGERAETDWLDQMLATPFDDAEAYGEHGSVFMKPDMSKVTTPVWIVGPQTGVVIHQLGSSETFIRSTGVEQKRFDFVDAWFPHSYKNSTIDDHERFFDHFLKGTDNGVMEGAPVRVQVRTGNGAHLMLEENEWPIARTTYPRWYLDAAASDWSGDSHGRQLVTLSSAAPTEEASASYSAELDRGHPIPAPTGYVGGTPRWSTGASFISEPMVEDMLLAGYMKAGLWLSSSSHDLDVYVSLRVIDENDHEIRYESLVPPIDPANIHPVGHGLLKVSHRMLDDERSTDYWPAPSHTEADHQPLTPGDVVYAEIGLYPSSALIRKGSRLQVDVQPYSPAGIPSRAYDESYHVGATNTVHTGPEHLSFIQLPIVPAREDQRS